MKAFPLKLGVPASASGLMRTSVVLKPFNELRARLVSFQIRYHRKLKFTFVGGRRVELDLLGGKFAKVQFRPAD